MSEGTSTEPGPLEKRVLQAARRIAGVVEHPSQFSPLPALWVDGREVAHVPSGHVDVRLTHDVIRERRSSLREDPRVLQIRRDWVLIRLQHPEDVAFVVELLKRAVVANRRRPGERPKPPPPETVRRTRPLHGSTTDDLER